MTLCAWSGHVTGPRLGRVLEQRVLASRFGVCGASVPRPVGGGRKIEHSCQDSSTHMVYLVLVMVIVLIYITEHVLRKLVPPLPQLLHRLHIRVHHPRHTHAMTVHMDVTPLEAFATRVPLAVTTGLVGAASSTSAVKHASNGNKCTQLISVLWLPLHLRAHRHPFRPLRPQHHQL